MFRYLLVPALLLTACFPEVRLGAREGIPMFGGSTELSTAQVVCGQAIAAGTASVTSRRVSQGCEYSILEDIQVLDGASYAQISGFTSLSGLLEAVELTLTNFSFIDAATNEPLDPATRIASATLAINGQQLADKGTLTALPQTLRLSGPALGPLRDAIHARQPASIRINAVVVLPDQPPPPARLRFEYRAQPVLVLGGPL